MSPARAKSSGTDKTPAFRFVADSEIKPGRNMIDLDGMPLQRALRRFGESRQLRRESRSSRAFTYFKNT